MTALETTPAHEAQLSSLAAKLAEASDIGLLSFASTIITNGDSTSDVVQILCRNGQQELLDLAVAIEWLDDSRPSTHDSVGSPSWLQNLNRTRITTCRRRWSETGMADYLIELTSEEEILTTLWLALDPSGCGLLAFCWPGSLIEAVQALRITERLVYRPFRKVSPTAARQSLDDAGLAGSVLLGRDDDLAELWRVHRPLLRFVLDEMQWTAASPGNHDQLGCV